MVIAASSLEFVRVKVSATENGQPVDPSADVVAMAFVKPGAAPATFVTATWEADGTSYHARCLIGPGGTVTLAPGDYVVWVKITDSPEAPVLRAPGLLSVRAA